MVEDSLEMKDRDILLRVDSRELLVAVGGLPAVGDREHGCNHGGNITASMERDIVWVGMHTIPTIIRGCMDTTGDSRWDIRGGGPNSPHMRQAASTGQYKGGTRGIHLPPLGMGGIEQPMTKKGGKAMHGDRPQKQHQGGRGRGGHREEPRRKGGLWEVRGHRSHQRDQQGVQIGQHRGSRQGAPQLTSSRLIHLPQR